jgi:hypothetical protein
VVEEALVAGRTGGHIPINCETQAQTFRNSSACLTKIEPDDSLMSVVRLAAESALDRH